MEGSFSRHGAGGSGRGRVAGGRADRFARDGAPFGRRGRERFSDAGAASERGDRAHACAARLQDRRGAEARRERVGPAVPSAGEVRRARDGAGGTAPRHHPGAARAGGIASPGRRAHRQGDRTATGEPRPPARASRRADQGGAPRAHPGAAGEAGAAPPPPRARLRAVGPRVVRPRRATRTCSRRTRRERRRRRSHLRWSLPTRECWARESRRPRPR